MTLWTKDKSTNQDQIYCEQKKDLTIQAKSSFSAFGLAEKVFFDSGVQKGWKLHGIGTLFH